MVRKMPAAEREHSIREKKVKTPDSVKAENLDWLFRPFNGS